MQTIHSKSLTAYLFLTMLVVSGLAACTVTAGKIAHLVVNFPFSNLIFSIFTYPIIDSICELWGRRIAIQTVLTGLAGQLLFALLIWFSIVVPASEYWSLQSEYVSVLSVTGLVVVASTLAYFISQLLDVVIYQRIRNMTHGKWMWMRSLVSTALGQAVDSVIFILIVFHDSTHKLDIFTGSITVKLLFSILAVPLVYLMVGSVRWYLDDIQCEHKVALQ